MSSSEPVTNGPHGDMTSTTSFIFTIGAVAIKSNLQT